MARRRKPGAGLKPSRRTQHVFQNGCTRDLPDADRMTISTSEVEWEDICKTLAIGTIRANSPRERVRPHVPSTEREPRRSHRLPPCNEPTHPNQRLKTVMQMIMLFCLVGEITDQMDSGLELNDRRLLEDADTPKTSPFA
jgi:hypothetical protein